MVLTLDENIDLEEVAVESGQEMNDVGAAEAQELARRLLGHSSSERPLTWVGTEAELATLVAELVNNARKSWPGISLSPALFIDHLATRLSGSSIKESLASIAASDLWLVCACLQRDPVALREFDRILLSVARSAGVERDMSVEGNRDLMQELREVLLVGDAESPPRLVLYSGLGSLRGWIRVVMLRDRVRFQVERKQAKSLDAAFEGAFLVNVDDPEFQNLKQENRAMFREALHISIEKLSKVDHLLLKCWLIDEMTLDQIGRFMQLHRITVGRRLTRLRRRILSMIKRDLTRRLELCKEELESLMRNIESRFDAPLSVVLARSRAETAKG
jgi:RNA polymerase sigma-70 factor (ECF subfamily)